MAGAGSQKTRLDESDVEVLEIRALHQRNQISESVAELKSQVSHDLDPVVNARRYFKYAAVGAAVAGVVAGYTFGGIFTT
jgi:hypothetical protein